jgi:hypothetical protein
MNEEIISSEPTEETIEPAEEKPGFFARWKQGIEMITAMQTVKINIMSTILIIIGIAIGLYSTWLTRTFWLYIILMGSFFITGTSLIGMLQKYLMLKKIEEIKKL